MNPNPLPSFPVGIVEFSQTFPDEKACQAYLFAVRWPNGFVFPKCGSTKAYSYDEGAAFQCAKHHITSLTAGTAMHKTKLAMALPKRDHALYADWIDGANGALRPADAQNIAEKASCSLAEVYHAAIVSLTIRQTEKVQTPPVFEVAVVQTNPAGTRVFAESGEFSSSISLADVLGRLASMGFNVVSSAASGTAIVWTLQRVVVPGIPRITEKVLTTSIDLYSRR